MPLAAWRGRPVLVVNTASFCGYTPQYRDLEALWRRYRERGLVVLGVPSNDFGQQEPGSAAEIKQFCETNYQVDFPLTEKYRVIGGDAHPFYRWVAAQLGEAGAPRWNFHKYLIGPDGSSPAPGRRGSDRSTPRLPAKSRACCRSHETIDEDCRACPDGAAPPFENWRFAASAGK